MFLYRPEYYKIDVDEDNMPTQGMGEVIIAKHRNGSTGTVKLKFIGKYTKFADFDAPSSDSPFPGFVKFESRLNMPSGQTNLRPEDMPSPNRDDEDAPF
jgi:replicative DNA helicase